MVAAIGAMEAILSEMASLAGAASAPGAAALQPAAVVDGGSSFAALFNAAINRLDGDVAGANATAKAFAAGSDDIPLSDVMISLERANLALQMAGNVRDKVTAAYSNVMNMQI
jgi:flagellar hook-basal body complex protein FliE